MAPERSKGENGGCGYLRDRFKGSGSRGDYELLMKNVHCMTAVN